MSSVQLLGSISGLTADQYEQAEAYIRQLMVEEYPDRNFGRGSTMHWALIHPGAQISAVQLENAELITSSMLLKAMRDDPDSVDPDLATLALSNYFITPGEATNAQGTVTVVVSTRTTYVLPSGTVFSSNNLQYVTTQAYYVYTNEGQVTQSNDRLLQQRSYGKWQFTVPVQAESGGLRYFLPQNSTLTMQNAPAEVVTVVSASDISGGTDAEGLVEVIDRIPDTLAIEDFGSRVNIAALVSANFPNTKTAVIGMSDPELHRDTYNLAGIANGGMADVYVATQSAIGTRTIQVDAELLNSTTREWRMVIPLSELAGLYAIESLVPVGTTQETTAIKPHTVERGYWLPTGDYVPILENGMQAAFSAYQTITILFTDSISNYTDLVTGSEQEYAVTVFDMPLIDDINSFLTDVDRVAPTTNVLVRGAVPCVTDISMLIRLRDSDFEDAIDVDGLRSALISRIYSLGFGFGVLSVSHVMDVAHDYITGRSDVGGTTVTLRGEILSPSSERLILNDGQEIRIPDRPDIQVTKRNTLFLTDSSRIDIQFTRVES